MYYSVDTQKFNLSIIILILVKLSKCDDLFLSNNLCLSYLSNNQISTSQSVGECVITCKIVSGQKACATRDLSCLAFASYIYQTPQAQNGNFYCNVLPFTAEAINHQPSSDQTRICNSYKSSLPYSSRESFCKLTCGYLYVITSPQPNAYEKKFQCDLHTNFVGCQGLKTFLQSQQLQPGSFSCEIYNHGDNFNYNRVASGNGNSNSVSPYTSLTSYPSFTGLFTSGLQNFVNTGSQISQGVSQGVLNGYNTFSSLIRAPFQFG